MKSGIVKQKWTPQEEAALRAGVQKYGAGKWRAIQRDATYGACLSSRSNVDLKDKWRNMSVSSNGFGSREKTARALAARMKQVGAAQSQAAASAVPLMSQKRILGSRFDQVIVEALKESNGGTKKEIAVHLQNRYHVPPNFRRLLTMNLKYLIEQGKLTKMRRNYALTENNFLDKVPLNQDSHTKVATESRLCKIEEVIASRFKKMSMEEAAIAAAQAVADAESAAMAAEEAARVAAIAEAEWEAAEAAAEMVAALASGDKKHLRMISALRGEFAIHV